MADIGHRRIDVCFVQRRVFEIREAAKRGGHLPEQHKQEGRDQHSQPDQRQHDENRVTVHGRSLGRRRRDCYCPLGTGRDGLS
jgi:hypothetical protein